MEKNVYFLVIDGLPDLPKGETALKKAIKPNMDEMAKNGLVGRILPINKKEWNRKAFASASQFGNLGLLGYKTENLYIRRGPLETIGADLEYKNGWLALRVDFGSVDENLVVKDRRSGRNILGLDLLVEEANKKINVGVEFYLQRTFGHRAALVFKSKKMSDEISDSDPLENGKKVNKVVAINKKSRRAIKTAKLVQKFLEEFYKLAKEHEVNKERVKKGIPPANYLLTREAGIRLPEIKKDFFKKYSFKNGIAIAENGVMKATCKIAGFDSLTVPEMSHENMLDFAFEKAKDRKIRKKYQVIYMHLKPVDEAGHDKNFERKVEAIEKIDDRLDFLIESNSIVIITADHITDYRTGKHEFGYVPILIYGLGKDKIRKFNEFTAYKSTLVFKNGEQLWKFVKNRMKK